MARLETKTIEELRDQFDYRKRFDVVLACAFEPEEKGNTKFELYNKIGKVVEGVGKRPFLPHTEINLEGAPRDIYTIINQIVIPTSDVVLCYLGLESTAGGIMLGSAIQNRIPIIFLYEKPEDFEGLRGYPKPFDKVDISKGNLNGLESCLKRFYQKND